MEYAGRYCSPSEPLREICFLSQNSCHMRDVAVLIVTAPKGSTNVRDKVSTKLWASAQVMPPKSNRLG